jgi:hypothetical protein
MPTVEKTGVICCVMVCSIVQVGNQLLSILGGSLGGVVHLSWHDSLLHDLARSLFAPK